MMDQDQYDAKGGNNGGSRAHESTTHDVRQPDRANDEAPNANEGADPSDEIRRANPGEITTADMAEGVQPDDPYKTEKLAKAGRVGFDPDEGAD
jgi:hypothetical protein